ncbi:MAG TPA: hypothetical protein VJ828_11960 [Lacipirellulaceae bacterium]|nr:hypothetical protein [Lacipirellulaceae bacterium]
MYYRFQFILAISIVASCVGSTSGALLFYDSFDYDTSGGASLSVAGAANWAKNQSSPDPTVQSGGGLTYPNLLVSSDTKSLQYDGSGINQGSGAPAATDGHTISGDGITTGSLYYSLLMKVPEVQSVIGASSGNGFAAGGNLVTGSFMAGLQTVAANAATNAPTSAAPLLIRSGDGTQFSSTYQLGTSKTATAADRQFYTGQSFSTGANAETVFVVLKYTFDSVNGDSANLFINPMPGAPEPAPQITHTGGTNLTLNMGIRSFFVRNNSVEPDVMLVDELRIGTTWADVTPAIPEPATGAIALLGVCLSLLWRRRIM